MLRKIALACVALAANAFTLSQAASKVKYVIVIMFENRSFDHLLGHLGLTDSRIDGIKPGMNNPKNPADPSAGSIAVDVTAAIDGGPSDPKHDFDSIVQQVYGYNKPMNNHSAPVVMDGFVWNAATNAKSFVMSAFNSTNLPVLSTLATEYAVFDAWHCSCPCPTNPNREFFMSGTAHGMTTNTLPDVGFPQQTHFKFLEAHNITWSAVYQDDAWMYPAFQDLRTAASLKHVYETPQFFTDLSDGTLSQYTMIEPRMASSATGPSNWQHPDNSVAAGEVLLNQVYTALRASKYWEESLLVITFDEHGGFFDHRPTPTEGIPAPDGVLGDNGFDYSRLGVRIPTVMVSPFIPKGTVISEPTGPRAPTSTSHYDATSVISSVNKIFGISETMTQRDAWAGTFHDLVSGPLRKDTPLTMPEPEPLSLEQLQREMAIPLNDHHFDSLNLLCHLSGHRVHPVCTGYAPAAVSGRSQKQAAYAASLGAPPPNARIAPWEGAAAFPHLYAPAARMLQQQHFEEISKTMWHAWRASVFAAAGETDPFAPVAAVAA